MTDLFRGDRCPSTVPHCTAEEGRNYRNYQNDELTEILKRTDTEVDQERRADLFRQADRIVARDLPVLPLYQPFDMIVYTKRLSGVRGNPSREGPLWNVQDWTLSP